MEVFIKKIKAKKRKKEKRKKETVMIKNQKKVNEEYIQLQTCITEEKLDNDWLLEHLSIKEIDPNNKDKKKREKEKKKDIIDDFEII